MVPDVSFDDKQTAGSSPAARYARDYTILPTTKTGEALCCASPAGLTYSVVGYAGAVSGSIFSSTISSARVWQHQRCIRKNSQSQWKTPLSKLIEWGLLSPLKVTLNCVKRNRSRSSAYFLAFAIFPA